MATPLEILKFNLQEREYPYFQDAELELLLESNDNEIAKASYKGCLLKAAADDGVVVSGIKIDSNREYWLTLAETFKQDTKKFKYPTSRKRVDGC